MNSIHLTKPYSFVPPHEGTFVPTLMRYVLPYYLKRTWGITHVRCIGTEKLKASLAQGAGVMLSPNHCRPCDPMVMGALASESECFLYIMASAHLFYQGKIQRWLLPRVGAFSIFREGLDRSALERATEILAEGKRPLVVFPEGVISRTNDRLNALMEGTQIMLRGAAKKRAEAGNKAPVVAHPVALRYFFHGNLEKTVESVLRDIESRLTWMPLHTMALNDRLRKIGKAIVCLKEIEYFEVPQAGEVHERIEKLVNAVLDPLETEWLKAPQKGSVIARVKKLRSTILPDIIKGELSETERDRCWRHLTIIYYAQQMSFYPPDYIFPECPPEHYLETVERFEEDLTDVARIHPPMSVVIEVGDAIEVSPERDKSAPSVMQKIEDSLEQMIEGLKNARPDIPAA